MVIKLDKIVNNINLSRTIKKFIIILLNYHMKKYCEKWKSIFKNIYINQYYVSIQI